MGKFDAVLQQGFRGVPARQVSGKLDQRHADHYEDHPQPAGRTYLFAEERHAQYGGGDEAQAAPDAVGDGKRYPLHGEAKKREGREDARQGGKRVFFDSKTV